MAKDINFELLYEGRDSVTHMYVSPAGNEGTRVTLFVPGTKDVESVVHIIKGEVSRTDIFVTGFVSMEDSDKVLGLFISLADLFGLAFAVDMIGNMNGIIAEFKSSKTKDLYVSITSSQPVVPF